MHRRVWLPTAFGILAGLLLMVYPILNWLAAGPLSPRAPEALFSQLGVGIICVAAALAGGFGVIRRDLAAGSLISVGALLTWSYAWSLPTLVQVSSVLPFLPTLIGAPLALAAGVVMARFHVEQPSRPQRDALPQP